MSSQYDDLLKKYLEQEATIKYLKVENIALKSQVDGLKNEVNQHKVAVDSLEQYSRRECLEIRGIPFTPSEDTSDIVANLAKLVNIDLDKKDRSYDLWTHTEYTNLVWSVYICCAASEAAVQNVDIRYRNTGNPVSEV